MKAKMKWGAMLCTLVMGALSVAATSKEAVYAEEVLKAPMYEFPLTGEIYVENKGKIGEYYEIGMKCEIEIQADGKMIFSYYATEQFAWDSQNEGTALVRIISDTSAAKYKSPEWASGCGIKSHSYIRVDCQDKHTTGLQPIYTLQPMYTKDSLFAYYGYAHDIQIDEGQMLGNTTVIPNGNMHDENTGVYSDKDGKMFVLNEDGSKNYFHDIVSVTANDVTIKKEIGDNWGNTPALVYRQGDVNNDGMIDKSDAVMLQKWLATETKEIPVWQAADMNNDNQIDAIDLSLLKKQLIEQAQGEDNEKVGS